MANRDDYRRYEGARGRDRWRDEDQDRRGRSDRDEPRAFEERGRFNSDQARYGAGSRGREGTEGPGWAHNRYGARFDQDRVGYGAESGREDERRGKHEDTSRFGGYGGQEYGLEAGERDRSEGAGRNRRDRGEREEWRPSGGAPYGDVDFNPHASGVEEYGAPHDYGYHTHTDREFDSDYLRWREEQMRSHDREYDTWRRRRQEQYDEEHRRSPAGGHDTYGRTARGLHSQRNLSGGIRDQFVAPGGGDTARKTASGGGFGHGEDRPSGRLESPWALRR